MQRSRSSWLTYVFGISLLSVGFNSFAAIEWKGKNVEATFGLGSNQLAKAYSVQEIACSAPANVAWPDDKIVFTFQFVNLTNIPLKVRGTAESVQYRMISDPKNVWWGQIYEKIADCGSVPIVVDLPPKGYANIEVTPVQPKQFGAYCLVVDLPGYGRQFAAAYLHVPKAEPGKVQFPTYAMDLRETSESMCSLFQRLGIKGARQEFGYGSTTNWQFKYTVTEWCSLFDRLSRHDITLMATIEGSTSEVTPFGKFRGSLNDRDEGVMDYPGDLAWMPQYDDDFKEWTCFLASTFGWPKGMLNAVELWNEPWEGGSISGWGADMIRYREIYTKMAQGVEAARYRGSKVLIGGTCSSMNTEDKLFCDGTNTFLKWMDFNSIHYQPLGTVPALIPDWVNRKSPYGPVRNWDTESWMANSEDRIAPVIASMRAQGLSRTAGVLHDNVRSPQYPRIREGDGKATKMVEVMQAWSPGAGIAAVQHFIGQRDFKQILFTNGLPWVFIFNGLPHVVTTATGATTNAPDPDDGTAVVVGDLGGVYERDLCKFRSVLGLANAAQVAELQKQLDALPLDAPAKERESLQRQIRSAQVLTGATLTLPSEKDAFRLFDLYGNPVPAKRGKLIVPLDGCGCYLRGDGTPGSFARLVEALRAARIDGYQPVELQASDLTARLAQKPALRIRLANILNRPVTGILKATLGKLSLDLPTQPIALAAYETKIVDVPVSGGEPTDDNSYPLSVAFDAGPDGTASIADKMHVNVIAKRTITVDGKLDDWTDVLPQVVTSGVDTGPSLTEKAWLPFAAFPEKQGAGLAVGYLAYDEQNFYFAAKVSDSTPTPGTLRFATRDDYQYFYPEVVHEVDAKGKPLRDLTWPAGVRRFTYRKAPDLPFGSGLWSCDGVQIAFNVLPDDKKGLLACAPGTMPGYQVYKDTDYEYYLHQVGEKWSGGTEVWRLMAPGVPRKHFYPRQPKAAKDGGPVDSAKLAIVQTANTRIVECALPWSEIPDVKAAMDAGRNIKFTFRVTDDKGPSYDMTTGRNVAKKNPLTFHPYWQTFGANEVEFAFEK